MKIFRNKQHPHRLSTLASLTVGVALLVSMPAFAQRTTGPGTSSGATSDTNSNTRGGPVDLLATITASGTDNSSANANAAAAPVIGSIDEAIEAISDDSGSDADTTGDAVAPASATLTVNDSPSTPSTQAVTETASDTVSETASGTASDSVAGDDGTATATVSLTRGTVVTSFGVADIGLEPSGEDAASLTTTIWRGTPVDRAILLLDSDKVVGPSPALSMLAQRIVAHRAVPPVGAADNADTLVTARLDWLASAGRSEALEDLVDQLPNDAPWLEWKQWLVETQLMSRRDDEACRNVMYQVSRTFDPFWHKAKVICNAARGDVAGAQFAADILKAMGVDDAAFSALVTTLLSGTAPGDFDPALLEPLHIVLMDAAHTAIDTDGLAALSEGSVQTAVGLRYLDPEARLVSTWRALDRGLITHEKAAKLWRSAKITPDGLELALTRHRSQPSALTRALGWRALDADKSPRRLAFVAAMMDADIASGAGQMMAPLYAELAREALEFEGAAEALAADEALAGKLGMLVSIAGPAALPDALATPDVRAWGGLLGLAAGTRTADIAPFDTLQMWHLLPLVEQAAASGASDGVSRDWIALAMPNRSSPASYLSISPLMLRALEQAAGSGSVAETVLLAHRIVGTVGLAEMHPSDAARIVAALSAADQQDTARALAAEVASAHLMAAMQSVEITLPPRAEPVATPGDSPIDGDTPVTDTPVTGTPVTGSAVTDTTVTGSIADTDDVAASDAPDAEAGTETDTDTGLQQDANADN